jgi:asparagine synthase (glutamine-hydrolysing)
LSGGIDSSLVCWAAKNLGADIPTYTLGMPGDSSDETHEAMQTVARLNLKNTTVRFDPADWRLNELLSAHGEPLACASTLGMLQLCQVASQSATVLLTGEGGDEAFLGYPAYGSYRKAERVAHGLPSGCHSLVGRARSLLPHWGRCGERPICWISRRGVCGLGIAKPAALVRQEQSLGRTPGGGTNGGT